MGLCFSHIFNQGGCSFSRITHQWFNLIIVEGFCSSRISSSRVRSRPILATCFSDASNFFTGRDGVWFLVFRGWWSWPELSPSMFLLSSLYSCFVRYANYQWNTFTPTNDANFWCQVFGRANALDTHMTPTVNLFEGEKNMVCKIENTHTDAYVKELECES